MSFNITDPNRCKHFQMLLDYMIQRHGTQKGIEAYSDFLKENNYDDHTPMIRQRGLKQLYSMLHNRTRKTKSNPIEKKKQEVLNDMVKTALTKDMRTGELYLYRKKIENGMRDAKLLAQFDQLGNSPNTPDPQDLRDLKRYYATATQMSPTSLQARSAKMLVQRITEKLIERNQATRKQIERFL